MGKRAIWEALHEGELAIAAVRDPLRVCGRIAEAVRRGTATGRDVLVMCDVAVRCAGRVEGVEQRMCGLLAGGVW